MNAGNVDNTTTRIVEFMKKKIVSPQRRIARDGQKVYCRFNCGKKCPRSGIHSHELHHCPNNPNRRTRIFGREACPVCGKTYDKHYLRQHLFTQHTATAAQIYGASTASPRPAALRPARSKVALGDVGPPAKSKNKKVVREEPAKLIEIPSSVGKRSSPGTKRESVLARMKKLGLG